MFMQEVIFLQIRKNASVCGQIIRDSGVANYILMDENVHSAQDVIDKMIPIREYVMMHPELFCL